MSKRGHPKGYKHSQETKDKIRVSLRGRVLCSPEAIKRMALTKRGKSNPWMIGNKFGCTTQGHYSPKGKNHYRWKENRDELVKSESKHLDGKYREWMFAVKNRDNWKCKVSNKDCVGRLEAHHILSWKEYPELRYDINNGIALCHFHHPRVRKEEKRLSPYFQELVSVSKE